MDVDDLRVAVTLLSFVAFVGVMVWALSRRNTSRFAEAANLPFVEDEQGTAP